LATRISARGDVLRKRPRQARSLATVDAILTAGAQVLGRRGWEGFTTNEVAEAAGASIGSLYQYFSNKRALLEAITTRHFADILAVLRRIDDATVPLPGRVDRLVQGMIAVHSLNPAVHRVLMEEAPRTQAMRLAHGKFQSEYHRHYAALIASSGNRRDRASDEAAAQVLSAAVAGAVHDAAHRGTLSTPLVKRELVDMIIYYLIGRQKMVPRAGIEPAT
jgi:AcrR family transcriptional regulator